MTSSQIWIDERTQPHTHKVHQLDEVDMHTTKIHLLMKKHEDSVLDHRKMVDSHMTCEECGDMDYMVTNCPTVCQDVNFQWSSS
jgi:hypothetical protein